jgi:hypothetical protein
VATHTLHDFAPCVAIEPALGIHHRRWRCELDCFRRQAGQEFVGEIVVPFAGAHMSHWLGALGGLESREFDSVERCGSFDYIRNLGSDRHEGYLQSHPRKMISQSFFSLHEKCVAEVKL